MSPIARTGYTVRMSKSHFTIAPGKRIKLSKTATDDTGEFDSKHEGHDATDTLTDQLEELQELLYAQSKHAILIVLQGMDTAGKDGAIRKVFGNVNPQGCRVASFKVPTPEELAHDFLWRIHQQTPGKGMITIFNRSHYESVLVERVHKLVEPKVWKERYKLINEFESLLVSEGTTILKFFLHISKKEQRERLQARLDDPAKHWKFNIGDVRERTLWNDYQRAYEDAVNECSTKAAPWYVIPADHKWYRDYAIASTLVDTLRGLKMTYPEAAETLPKTVD